MRILQQLLQKIQKWHLFHLFIAWINHFDKRVLRYTVENEELFGMSEWEDFTPGYIINSNTNNDKRLVIKREGKYMVMILRCDKGTMTQKHAHQERHIIVQVGMGKVLDLETNTLIQRGDTFHIKSGTVYEFMFLEDTVLQATLIFKHGKSL